MTGWPEFHDEPMADGRTWSARYDSYDQHYDDVYYAIRLSDGAAFTAQLSAVGTEREDDATVRDSLRRALASVAADGKANTTYVARDLTVS